jgi:hypothetical protein
MKRLGLYGVGLMVALLLALVVSSASGQGAGGSGKGGSGTTVTVKQLGSGSSVVYYRVGSGNWQPLTIFLGQGTFTATGEYEVAARCDNENTLNLFKASTSYQTQVPFSCPPGPRTRSVRFTISLPSSVGGVRLQSNDWVVVGSTPQTYKGTNPMTVDVRRLKASAGAVIITLYRPSISTSGVSTTPYGYKVVSLGADDTSVLVDSRGWEAFTSTNTKNLSISAPKGFNGVVLMSHVRDDYLGELWGVSVIGTAMVEGSTSVTGKYALLPWDGVYVAYYNAKGSDSSTDTLTVIQDTGGNDWNVIPPAPWTSGQFSVNGDTLTFARTDAKAFTAEFSGLAQRTGGTPLKLKIFVQAAPNGNTTYQIPVIPDLDYRLISNPSSVNFYLRALVRDRGVEYLYALEFTEELARGIDMVMAEREGTYLGSRYTLP